MRNSVKPAVLILCLLSFGVPSSGSCDTRSECIAEARDTLSSCYSACSGQSNEKECRSTCRERYQSHVQSCPSS